MRKIAFAVAAAASLSVLSTGSALAISFTPGATLQVGDKLFTFNDCIYTAQGTTTGSCVGTDGIQLLPLIQGNLIGFAIKGPGTSGLSATGLGSILDILLDYDVQVNVGPLVMTDAHLAYFGSSGDFVGSDVGVTEPLSDYNTTGLGSILDILLDYDVQVNVGPLVMTDAHLAYFGSSGDFVGSDVGVTEPLSDYNTGVGDGFLTADGFDTSDATPLLFTTTHLEVLKDLSIYGNDCPENPEAFGLDCQPGSPLTYTISEVDQLFSQNNTVPEPATLALFGAGLAGLGARRRRKA